MSNQELGRPNSTNLQNQLAKPNSMIGNWIENEEQLQIARTFDDKQIRYYDKEDMTKLVEVMAKWRVLLGVTSDSTHEELIVICQFVYDNFKSHTLSDIKLAMNWIVSGKVDIGFVSQKTISAYYISRAMNAYDEEKRKLFKKVMEQKSNYQNKLEMETKPNFSPEQRADNFKKLILELYDSYKKGGFFLDFGDSVYNWIKRSKAIPLTQSLVDAAVKYGKDQFLEERKEESKKRLVKAIEPESREYREKKLARHYIILEYFKSTSIQAIINTIKPEHF